MSSLHSQTVTTALPCVPYLATQQWYAEWLRLRLQGCGESEARAGASAACGLRARDFTHCELPSAESKIRLSVAVEGGGNVLKRLPPESVSLSGHGRWPSVHLGALNAVYGRSAYFDHLHDRLTAAYTDVEGRPLSALCDRLHDVQIALAIPQGMLQYLSALPSEQEAHLRNICADYAHAYRAELPFLDLLMHYGPDAIFVLLSTFYSQVDAT